MKHTASHPILILHGWGLSGKKYFLLQTLLENDGYAVYAPDFSGFDCNNPPPKPLTLEMYVEELNTFLHVKKINRPIVIAHSFGGRVALAYNRKYPGRIEKAIVSGVPGFRPVSRKRYILSLLIAKIGKLIFAFSPLLPFAELIRTRYYKYIGVNDFVKASQSMKQTFRNIVQHDLRAAVAKFDIPTLLLWGEKDMVVPLFVARKMLHTMPRSSLVVIPDCGHNLLIETPEKAIDTIVKFIR